MICPRCKIEMLHIDFPVKKYEVLSPFGKPLAEAVERCPCCSAEIPSRITPTAIVQPKALPDAPEQLSLFTPTVGGLH